MLASGQRVRRVCCDRNGQVSECSTLRPKLYLRNRKAQTAHTHMLFHVKQHVWDFHNLLQTSDTYDLNPAATGCACIHLTSALFRHCPRLVDCSVHDSHLSLTPRCHRSIRSTSTVVAQSLSTLRWNITRRSIGDGSLSLCLSRSPSLSFSPSVSLSLRAFVRSGVSTYCTALSAHSSRCETARITVRCTLPRHVCQSFRPNVLPLPPLHHPPYPHPAVVPSFPAATRWSSPVDVSSPVMARPSMPDS